MLIKKFNAENDTSHSIQRYTTYEIYMLCCTKANVEVNYQNSIILYKKIKYEQLCKDFTISNKQKEKN